MPSPTSRLSAVAQAASVSVMTVSRVLRNAPHVSTATRQRVLHAATKVDYRPDPQLARLMTIVRGAKVRRSHATIGIVRECGQEAGSSGGPYQFVTADHLRRRAEEHGYAVDEFFIGSGALTPSRLNAILRARGIEGIIVAPHSPHAIASQLDYSAVAAVTLGYGLQSPSLHRASTNMSHGILDAASRLERRGYRRIGLAVTHWVDARADYTYSGALLHYQASLPLRQRVPLMYIPDHPVEGAEVFCRWIRRCRPDAVISLDTFVPHWLTVRLKLRIPEHIGLVVHDWAEHMTGCAGIYHRRPWVAAAAVDLLVTQLLRNERGIPDVPQQVLIPPAWIEGATLLPSGAGACK